MGENVFASTRAETAYEFVTFRQLILILATAYLDV